MWERSIFFRWRLVVNYSRSKWRNRLMKWIKCEIKLKFGFVFVEAAPHRLLMTVRRASISQMPHCWHERKQTVNRPFVSYCTANETNWTACCVCRHTQVHIHAHTPAQWSEPFMPFVINCRVEDRSCRERSVRYPFRNKINFLKFKTNFQHHRSHQISINFAFPFVHSVFSTLSKGVCKRVIRIVKIKKNWTKKKKSK